jgi:hypothetical protein
MSADGHRRARLNIYIRGADGGDTNYHWCLDCPNFPRTVTHSTLRRPLSNVCPQCDEKERNGTCRAE